MNQKELKRKNLTCISRALGLLIEPEGIETAFCSGLIDIITLLIEPEGIETYCIFNFVIENLKLLIEPEGIETRLQ